MRNAPRRSNWNQLHRVNYSENEKGKTMSKQTAAAILVQTIFDHNEPLRNKLLQSKTDQSPEAAADFMRAYYIAMRTMIEKLP